MHCSILLNMSNSKTARYKRILLQLNALLGNKTDAMARMATINAVLYHKMQDFFWVGFYLLKDDILSVGPYQGPLACLELEKCKGVCWTCIQQKKVIIVPDVHAFPGHITCDSRSKSEIAVPLINTHGEVAGVLDIDSRKKSCFNKTDAKYLEEIAMLIYK